MFLGLVLWLPVLDAFRTFEWHTLREALSDYRFIHVTVSCSTVANATQRRYGT